MSKTIAILFHEADRNRRLPYVIVQFAGMWQQMGHVVHVLFGVDQFVPADVVVVHVDLSVVPFEYLRLASRYPVAVNGQVRDIRKSVYSTLLVKPGDGYDGPVIVKSNLNYAGIPEQHRGVVNQADLPHAGRSRSPVFASPLDYRLFDRASEVPNEWYSCTGLVVEQFVPEIDGGHYQSRHLHFLGDRFTCIRLASSNPIVSASSMISIEPCEPHEEILELREKMRFDYGKFDYVVRDGKPVLLDANKTTGAGGGAFTPSLMAGRRYRAEGINYFFKDT